GRAGFEDSLLPVSPRSHGGRGRCGRLRQLVLDQFVGLRDLLSGRFLDRLVKESHSGLTLLAVPPSKPISAPVPRLPATAAFHQPVCGRVALRRSGCHPLLPAMKPTPAGCPDGHWRSPRNLRSLPSARDDPPRVAPCARRSVCALSRIPPAGSCRPGCSAGG